MTTTTLTTTIPIALAHAHSAGSERPTAGAARRGPGSVGLAAAALLVWIAATLLVLTGQWSQPVPTAIACSGSSATTMRHAR